jgi:hypothetical protein
MQIAEVDNLQFSFCNLQFAIPPFLRALCVLCGKKRMPEGS